MTDELKHHLEQLCNRILTVGVRNKWDNHLTVTLHENTVRFAKRFMQEQPIAAVEEAASDLEGSLLVCATASLEAMPDIESMVEDLHVLVEEYELTFA